MEEKQCSSEVLNVFKPSSDGLEFLNVSIDSFSSSVVSSQCHCVDHSVYVSIEHICDFGNLRNACTHCLIAPHNEQGGSCRPAAGCMHDIPEILLDAPCPGHLIVGSLMVSNLILSRSVRLAVSFRNRNFVRRSSETRRTSLFRTSFTALLR